MSTRTGLSSPADLDIDLSRRLDELELDETDDEDEPVLRWKDGRLVDTWREGYPYDERMRRPDYDTEKRLLQIELLRLQNWVKGTGQRIVVVFEGRDAAGKGGTIKRFTEHLNPRGSSVVALEKPSEHGEAPAGRNVEAATGA
jgi:polyphosphate kinase 2 (PPK2 family)